MSISSEITRITNKRDASFAKVALKGVIVPSGSTIDDLPDLIDSISIDPTYSVTKNLTSVTSSCDDTKVIQGNSFFTELTPASGYVISSITVTMGGVDITDQVFKAGTGAKTITANGTYSAADDNLSGYTAVAVAVPSQSASLGTKSITSNGTYNASSDGYDGYSQVTVNVPNTYSAGDEGKVVSNGALVSQTSDTVTTNGTVDTTLINSLTVNVSSGTGKKYKSGTYTPAATYNTTANRAICTTSDIGFTPNHFILAIADRSDQSGIQGAVLRTSFDNFGASEGICRTTTRYSNTTNSLGATSSSSSWTTQTNNFLYLSSGTVYFRTTSSYLLTKDVTYNWYAYE